MLEGSKVKHAKPTRADEALAAMLSAVSNFNDQVGQLHRGIRTLNAAQRIGVEARPANGASQRLSSSPGRLAGWSLYNPAATAVQIRVRDSPDTQGDVIAEISVLATADATRWLFPAGVGYATGLYLDYVTGGGNALPLEGAVYLAPAAAIA
jgi:hypothetical protein